MTGNQESRNGSLAQGTFNPIHRRRSQTQDQGAIETNLCREIADMDGAELIQLKKDIKDEKQSASIRKYTNQSSRHLYMHH